MTPAPAKQPEEVRRCFSALEEFHILRSMTVREYRDLQALGLDPLSPEAQQYRKVERIKGGAAA